MHYTYIIQSITNPNKTYIGFTSNLKQRLLAHNSGRSIYTKSHGPWSVKFYCAFDKEDKAIAFEKYLKSGSGKAFTKKHF